MSSSSTPLHMPRPMKDECASSSRHRPPQQPLEDDSVFMSDEEDYDEDDDVEDDDVEDDEDEDSNPPKQLEIVWNFICCEARSVSVWCVLAPVVRLVLALLTQCAATTTGITSFVARWIVIVFPSHVSNKLAPGFSFGWSVLLFGVADTFYGPLPNLPVRICEMVMGRITFQELGMCIPVHVSCTLSTIKAFAYLEEKNIWWWTDLSAIDPIVYSTHHPWIVDLIREVFVTTFFVVGLLVLPELLTLNHIPRWMTMFLLYPLYNFEVDANGQSSTFAPNVLYSLVAVAHDRQDNSCDGGGGGDAACGGGGGDDVTFQFTHMIGPLLGGVVAGHIMKKYFPDDS